MGKRKRKNRKKRFDSNRIKSIPLIRNLSYGHVITQDGKRIIVTLANNKGATFMFIYSGVEYCTDTRDSQRLTHKEAEAELVRLLGAKGKDVSRQAIFRSAVIW